MSDEHTKEEVSLMAEYFGYNRVPGWIFMGALQEWGLRSREVLANAKAWEAQGKPPRKEWGDSPPSPTTDDLDSISCPRCGIQGVPNWDGKGHCIRCDRDIVLASSDDLELEKWDEVDEELNNFGIDYSLARTQKEELKLIAKAKAALTAREARKVVEARTDELKMARDLIPKYTPTPTDQLQGKTAYNEYIKERLAHLQHLDKESE